MWHLTLAYMWGVTIFSYPWCSTIEDSRERQCMQLNADKGKEMIIDLKKKTISSALSWIDEKELAVANSVKILGITMSNDLKWKVHTNEAINPRTYTQIHTPTVLQEGIDEIPPWSFWYVAVLRNDFAFSGKPLTFSTKWGIFYMLWVVALLRESDLFNHEYDYRPNWSPFTN